MARVRLAEPTVEHQSSSTRGWHLLLLLPFIGLLWVPFYNRIDPTLFGIPFFYWYQFLWVILTSILILVVHAMTKEAAFDGPAAAADDTGRRP